jgi:aminopeptidase
MQTNTHLSSQSAQSFPPFDLRRFLQTIFEPKAGEKLCILIDLDNPLDMVNFRFLRSAECPVQKKAYDIFYQGLVNKVMKELKLASCDIFAYKKTGGSNLELPNIVYAPDGGIHPLESDIYSKYDIILCIGTYSATAPLTAASKRFGFRGATMHGLNDIILKSGLAVDYNDVSRKTEKLRK